MFEESTGYKGDAEDNFTEVCEQLKTSLYNTMRLYSKARLLAILLILKSHVTC